RVEDAGRVFEWCLERIVDRNGNTIELVYRSDPEAAAEKHIQRIRWGRPNAFFAALFVYEAGRPDVTTSFRSGFELRTSLRLVRIDVVSSGVPAPGFALRDDLDGDGATETLIRRYAIEYDVDAPI